ncbi:MAG TPA: (2Fe-2S)-binding protein [Chloroflexi bacterium]|nr:(2Fe-2S)-binding protein [Chloroflexota bacterium]
MDNKSKANESNEVMQAVLPQPLTRRSFMKLILNGLCAMAAVEIGAISLSFLQSQSAGDRIGGHVLAGQVKNFPLNSVTDFTSQGFYLIRDIDGNFLAIYQKCPHLGCNVIWETETSRFVCPCHASSFDMYGNLESPPVPRPLDTFDVHIENEDIVVDTTQVNRREKFDVQQLAFPPNGMVSE